MLPAASGALVGVGLSEDMLDRAGARVHAHGWRNVRLVRATLQEAAVVGTLTGGDDHVNADSQTTEQVRRHYDDTASKYNRQIKFFERLLFGDGRSWVCSQAAGDVLELAVGTGRNLRYYSDGVHLTGIELSPAMLELAHEEAAAVGRQADLREGDAQALDFPDESFDTVTCTLSLCTIPDDRAAVREVMRVLRPGGRFVLMEHVRSPVRIIRGGQRVLEPLFLRLEHDHLTREPLEQLTAAGFEIEQLERSKVGIVERVSARKPDTGPTGQAA